MAAKTILYPLLAMVLLTAVVALKMLRSRVVELRTRRIHPQKIALSSQSLAMLEDTRAADNFRNLFEAPVLFYAAVLVIYAGQLTSPAYLVLAWAYVATRLVHSAIQCSYNRVMHRFAAFASSLFVLWTIYGLIAYDLLGSNRG